MYMKRPKSVMGGKQQHLQPHAGENMLLKAKWVSE